MGNVTWCRNEFWLHYILFPQPCRLRTRPSPSVRVLPEALGDLKHMCPSGDNACLSPASGGVLQVFVGNGISGQTSTGVDYCGLGAPDDASVVHTFEAAAGSWGLGALQ